MNNLERYGQALNRISLYYGQFLKPLRGRAILQIHQQQPTSVAGVISSESRVKLWAAEEDLKESRNGEQNPESTKGGEP